MILRLLNLDSTARLILTFAVFTIAVFPAAQSRAAIIGIVPGTYAYNHSDAGSPPIIGNDLIQLTTGPNQRRSIWFYAPQDISLSQGFEGFVATFTYRAGSIGFGEGGGNGITFAIQNSVQGTGALGTNLGYEGIAQSLAVTIELSQTPANTTRSGVYSNGILGGGSALVSPVNARTGTNIDVAIAYNHLAGTLAVSMTQGENVYGPAVQLVGDVTSILQGSTAYVGFTARSGSAGSNHYISNFEFHIHNVPEPGSSVMLAIGAATILGGGYAQRRRARRSGGGSAGTWKN